MKSACLLLVVIMTCANGTAADKKYQHGTIVRMRMSECTGAAHGLMAALSGAPPVNNNETCPEYTLVSDKVVYRIVGKTSSELIGLAEQTNFRFKDKEMLVLTEDERHEVGFRIREMMLRADWEREQQRSQDTSAWLRRHVQAAAGLANEQ